MLTFQPDVLEQVIATAKQSAAGTAWVSRIERAGIELATNPYIEVAGDHLLIGSPSGNTYEVNGVCQCQAYTHGSKPCWHRAAKQLIVRYNEAMAAHRKPYNRPLSMFQQQDAETARLAAKGEMRAQLEKQQAHRKALREMDELFS
jgi:hypothetical protein